MILTISKSKKTHLALMIGVGFTLLMLFIQKQSDSAQSVRRGLQLTELESYDGKKWSLRRFAGQPLLVNLWGSWCTPCIKELPIFNALATKYQHSLAVVGLAVGSPATEVARLVEQFSIKYPIAKIKFSDLEAWGPNGLPATFLFNAQGAVVWTANGPVTREALEEALQKVIK